MIRWSRFHERLSLANQSAEGKTSKDTDRFKTEKKSDLTLAAVYKNHLPICQLYFNLSAFLAALLHFLRPFWFFFGKWPMADANLKPWGLCEEWPRASNYNSFTLTVHKIVSYDGFIWSLKRDVVNSSNVVQHCVYILCSPEAVTEFFYQAFTLSILLYKGEQISEKDTSNI